MKNIIGIMGGTFNPIHRGHIRIAECAHEQFNIPKILVMPSGEPAYKETSNIVSSIHRLNMVKLAVNKYDYMYASNLETKRHGKTYTADTLRILKDSYDYIYFILGADSLLYLDKWYEPDYICSHCHILCANRNLQPSEALINCKNMLTDRFNAVIDFIECENLPYSSTMVRNMIKNNESVSDIVGAEVEDYIMSNNLYK